MRRCMIACLVQAAYLSSSCAFVKPPGSEYRVAKRSIQADAHGEWQLVKDSGGRGAAWARFWLKTGPTPDHMIAIVPTPLRCDTLDAVVRGRHVVVSDRVISVEIEIVDGSSARVSTDGWRTFYLAHKTAYDLRGVTCE